MCCVLNVFLLTINWQLMVSLLCTLARFVPVEELANGLCNFTTINGEREMISGVMQIETSLVMDMPAFSRERDFDCSHRKEGERSCSDWEKMRRGLSQVDCIVNLKVWRALESTVRDKEINEYLDVSKIVLLPRVSFMQVDFNFGAARKKHGKVKMAGHVSIIRPEAFIH
jgi:hypothetical protein